MNLSLICQHYFLSFALGVLLANAQRRSIITWISAAKLSQRFRNVFYHSYQKRCEPTQRGRGQRGRPKLKGDKICMNLRTSHKQGWQETECQLYGKRATKTYKTFVAVSEMTDYKPVRVVIIQEANGWIPLLSTNTSLSVQEIIERYGVRFGIE
ncbi:MAG: hypothetical protein LBU65_15935 [Planctomycetaceae bacterium]|jgi:hypothetical protein|nr:hypothetical protein [Planctomycetaceae bacterium]